MKENQPRSPQGGSLNIQDVLLSLFKHKWKILLLTILGLAASGVVYLKRTPMYESRTKLLVKYVMDRAGIDPYESQKEAGGRYGEHVLKAEIELLTSLDGAGEVAKTLGSEEGGAPSLSAVQILRNLTVGAAAGSNVIHVSYRHEDPRYARDVLSALLNRYMTEHLRVHRSGGAFDLVSNDREEARLAVGQTEAELNRLMQENMILSSLAATAVALEDQTTSTLAELRPAEAALVEQETRVKEIESTLGIASQEDGKDPEDVGGPAIAVQLGAHVLDEYRFLMERIGTLRKRELELLQSYTEGSGNVVRVRSQIKQLEGQREALLKKHPELVAREVLTSVSPLDPQLDLGAERANLIAQRAKVKVLQEQYEAIKQRYNKLSTDRVRIERLERQLSEETEKYSLLSSRLDKALVDQTLNPANMPNISTLQKPSLPAKTYDKLTTNIMYGLAASGLVAGIGLAFLLEFVLDGRIKQPLEIETRLRMPLMMSIPYMGRKERHARLADREAARLNYSKEPVNGAENKGGSIMGPSPAEPARSASSVTGEFLRSYAEAIRDRIVYYFELNNMTHKPKLVAFAGFTEGAGTTTLATSVARAFAEGDDTKVLLVDMNPAGQDEHRDKKASSPLGRLEVADKPLGPNLFVATAPQRGANGGSRALAPKSFYELMPKFRASEFDYIIFDMPPFDQTSPTLSMAGFMDQVLLVLDAENTNRERLKRTHSRLLDSKADVTCIVNKTRRHAPRWVQSEV